MRNALNWFELGTKDLDRATRFYEQLLGRTLKRETIDGMPMAIFLREGDGAVGGALVFDDKRRPGPGGALIYLNADADLAGCVGRVAPAGGKVVMPVTSIGPQGFIAVFVDTEGNTVALHSAS